MMFESEGLQPAIINSLGCVGLNQLCKGNYGVFAPLSVTQYRQLTAAQQLPYVFKFWRGILKTFGRGQTFFTGRDLYWLNIGPAYFVPNAPDSYRVPFTQAQYLANRGALDHGNKGFITAGDFAIAVQAGPAAHPALWAALVAAIGTRETVVAAETGAGVVAFVGVVAGLVGAAVYLTWPEPRYARS